MVPLVSARAHFSFIMVSDYHNAAPMIRMKTKMALIKKLQTRKKLEGEDAGNIKSKLIFKVFTTIYIPRTIKTIYTLAAKIDCRCLAYFDPNKYSLNP